MNEFFQPVAEYSLFFIKCIGGTLLAGMMLYGASRLISAAYFKSKLENDIEQQSLLTSQINRGH